MGRPRRAQSDAREAEVARRSTRSPGMAEARLRRYIRAQQLDAFRRGVPSPLTSDELAAILDLDPEPCRRALVGLSRRGEIEVLIHPGGRFELQPCHATRAGSRPGRAADSREPGPHRVLTTVLFTDIVNSTERAAALGDRRWRDLL